MISRKSQSFKQTDILPALLTILILSPWANKVMGINQVQIEEWNETKFFKVGIPPITELISNITLDVSSYDFIPKYVVLEKDLNDEENVYVWLEKTEGVSLHLYGADHPEFPNYKFDLTYFPQHKFNNWQIALEKCENELPLSCHNLTYCQQGKITHSEKDHLSKKVVFISYLQSTSEIEILVQYKHCIVKCRDPYNPLKVEKLVMHGIERQKLSSKKVSFRKSLHPCRTDLPKLFELVPTTSIYLQTLQCLDCKMEFHLNCQEDKHNLSVKGSDGLNVIFSDSIVTHGWANVRLQINASQKTETCSLSITTTSDYEDLTIKKFWAVSQISVLDHFSAEGEDDDHNTGTTVNDTSKNNETIHQADNEKCPCQDHVILMSLILVFVILTFGAVGIILCKLKCRLNRLNSLEMQELHSS